MAILTSLLTGPLGRTRLDSMCETLQMVSPGEKRETALIICDIIGYKLLWLEHKPSSLFDLEI